MENMDPHQNSATRTPLNSVAQRRSKSRSCRQSYRSCLGAASRLCFTPAMTSRRLNTIRKAPKLHNIVDKVDAQQLASLMKTEWQLSCITPLYQFCYTQLKSYARQLSAYLTAEKQQGLGVGVEGALSLRVSFSVVQGMAQTELDPETVLIQIYSKPLFARQDELQKEVWKGWLTCINGSPDYINSLPKDFICLPLFGSSGTEALAALVKSWFQRNFDCCFAPLDISHTSLQWLVALWTNCHAESDIQQLKMMWTLPVVPLLRVTYSVDPIDAWQLWCSVRRDSQEMMKEQDSIDIEEVMRLMRGLMCHFYRHFRVDLSAGSLSSVSTALGTAKCSGKIKFSNSKYMTTMLTLLTECALLKMPI
ncbi:centromere protein L [Dunckerocampus dactyliophorus]|uniref:centromere protein L n=1 Tax=Dunckerocampus dactyliophorus TaxID=161453 RepID=UPI0024062404|nr:centromere protein L [Dunckerocampus dactyliophorus]